MSTWRGIAGWIRWLYICSRHGHRYKMQSYGRCIRCGYERQL